MSDLLRARSDLLRSSFEAPNQSQILLRCRTFFSLNKKKGNDTRNFTNNKRDQRAHKHFNRIDEKAERPENNARAHSVLYPHPKIITQSTSSVVHGTFPVYLFRARAPPDDATYYLRPLARRRAVAPPSPHHSSYLLLFSSETTPP